MAGIKAILQATVGECPVAYQTMLQIKAPTNQRLTVHAISISFEGEVTTDAPILVDIVRQSDAGTGGDAVTPYPIDQAVDETLQATGLEDIDGGDPTDVNDVLSEYVHPQGGYTWHAHILEPIVVVGGGRLAICTTAADLNNCVCRFEYEE